MKKKTKLKDVFQRRKSKVLHLPIFLKKEKRKTKKAKLETERKRGREKRRRERIKSTIATQQSVCICMCKESSYIKIHREKRAKTHIYTHMKISTMAHARVYTNMYEDILY